MSKDEPLHSVTRSGNRTVWLDRDTSDEARDKFYDAWTEFMRQNGDAPQAGYGRHDRTQWNMAWAAAIAAFSFVMEGRIGPRS